MKARPAKLIPVLFLIICLTLLACSGKTVEKYLDFREELDKMTPDAITGRVVNSSNGIAITGASIEILKEDDTIADTQISDVNGYFTSITLEPGVYKILITRLYYVDLQVEDIIVKGTVDLGNIGMTSDVINPGSVSGKVLDTTHSQVGGASITITDGAGFTDSTATNNAGNFAFAAVPDGSGYTVTIEKSGYNTLEIDNISVVISTNTDLGTIYIISSSLLPGSVSGKVVDLTFTPVQDAIVTIRFGGTFIEDTNSNGSGEFSFPTVPEGNGYSITVEKIGFNTSTKNNITVTASTNNDVGTIFLVPDTATSGTFSGTVIDSYKGDPLNGATVKITRYDNTIAETINIAGNQNTFTSSSLDPGSYTVTVSKEGYFDFEVDNKIINGGNTDLYSLALCELLTGNQVRIFVLWASDPDDLSLHCVGPTSTYNPEGEGAPFNRFHIYWENHEWYNELDGQYESGSRDDATAAFVFDNTHGIGPETINLGGNYYYEPGNRIYTFTLHNWTLGEALKGGGTADPDEEWDGGAYMPIARIYDSEGLRMEIPFPSTLPPGNELYWKVCKIEITGNNESRDDRIITVPTSDHYLDYPHSDYTSKAQMDW